ncbi:hypothetical protein HZS_4501 [Henneguya salminicola]|nr:hypothetical protein HZS_4501 [Henneguya salminicola]
MNAVFDDCAHFFPDIIKRLQANPEALQDVESLLASRCKVNTIKSSFINENSNLTYSAKSFIASIMTYEEIMSIERLKDAGFSESVVLQGYFASNRNEQEAAICLMALARGGSIDFLQSLEDEENGNKH